MLSIVRSPHYIYNQVHRPKVKREKIQVPKCIRLIDKTRQLWRMEATERGALQGPAADVIQVL